MIALNPSHDGSVEILDKGRLPSACSSKQHYYAFIFNAFRISLTYRNQLKELLEIEYS